MKLQFKPKAKKTMIFTPKKSLEKGLMIIKERAKAKNPKITA